MVYVFSQIVSPSHYPCFPGCAKPYVSGKLSIVVRDHSRYACSKKVITTKEENIMALYMDIHRQVEGMTGDAAAGAYARDLDVQEKYGANSLKCWLDAGTVRDFCDCQPPSKGAAEPQHGRADGIL